LLKDTLAIFFDPPNVLLPKEDLMKKWSVVLALALIFSFALPAFVAGQQMSKAEQEMMEKQMKYAMVTKNHDFLKKYVGTWDVETKGWMSPGTDPMMGKGTMKNALIFDGRYVKCEFEGMMGQPFKGLEIIGYDLFQNKYTTFWIDTMSTSFFLTSGTLDPTGMILTETGTAPDAMTGGTTKVKDVTTFLADGKFKFEMFMIGPDGKEFKSMELVATRKSMM
jgi:hypothetical protein